MGEFRVAFQEIEAACPEKGERLGSMLIAGYRGTGYKTSLLKFTKSVAAGPLEFADAWGSCSGVIASVATDYKTGHLR